MANETQRDIELDLQAYKQRRQEQLGAPIELHPATRKLLQGEAARTNSRPLLTSEEAAKNFVRSFVMSHQRPSFFARNRHRVIWGGAMFACFALVLAVLRHDPKQSAQQLTFPDQLPAPPPMANPQATPPAGGRAGSALPQSAVTPTREIQLVTKSPATPASVDRAAALVPAESLTRLDLEQRGAPPTTANRRELDVQFAAPLPTTKAADKKSIEQVKAVALDKTESPSALARVQQASAGQLGKNQRSRMTGDELQRSQLGAAADIGRAVQVVVAPVRPTAIASQLAESYGATAVPPTTQRRFLQLDNRAGYRPNLNSPPVPQVMQDFDFERSGDRVRIVDRDGSTYEGTVLPAPTAEAVAKLNYAAERKAADTQASGGIASYRFIASGVNRKLNQSVEFRGEWQPAAPAPPADVALQSADFKLDRSSEQLADTRQKSQTTNALARNTLPPATPAPQQQQLESPVGRISGRAIVGGKQEFEIQAVPK